MRFIKSKRGISDVVGIAVITMLTVVAVSLIWSYFSGLGIFLDSQLSPVSDCLQLNTEISAACYNSQTQQIEAMVRTSPGDIIDSITFITGDGQNSQSYICGSSSEFQCLAECFPPTNGETKLIFLQSINQPTQINFYPNACSQFSKSINQIPNCS